MSLVVYEWWKYIDIYISNTDNPYIKNTFDLLPLTIK